MKGLAEEKMKNRILTFLLTPFLGFAEARRTAKTALVCPTGSGKWLEPEHADYLNR